MQITITIKDKLIKTAIENALDCEIYEHWDTATLKAAKIPKISTMVTEIFNDPKFQAQLVEQFNETAECAIEDQIFDMMDEIQIPQIVELGKLINDSAAEMELLEQEKREAAEVARMIKVLAKAGFKIEKA